MSKLLLINPRRKRRASTKRRTSAKRSTVAKRARRRPTTRIVVANPRRRSAARRIHRNPRRRRGASRSLGLSSLNGFIKHTLTPSFVGASGALGLDMLLAVLPLPAMLQTGALRPVVRIGGAALLGIAASKAVNRRVGEQVAAGASIVVLYDILKNFTQTMMPALPLSGYPSNLEYYSAGQNVGEYFAPQVTAANDGNIVQPMTNSMGEYVYG